MGLTGLASPISLAPKSARPMAGNELPPDLLAALAASANQGVDIDLTLPDSSHSMDMPGMEPHGSRRVSGDVGNSADKPIELDLDLDGHMTDLDLFGDVPGGDQHTDVDGLFNDASSSAAAAGVSGSSNNNMGDIFNALSGNQRETDDLIASLGAQSEGSNLPGSSTATAPSPASLLASLASSSQHGNELGMPHDMSGSSGSIDAAHAQGQAFDYNNLNMADISSSFGPYFEGKGSEDMIAQLLGVGTDSGSSHLPDSGAGSKPGETSAGS